MTDTNLNLKQARNFIAFDCGVHVKHVHVGDDGRVTIACLCDEKHFDRAFTPRLSANGDYVTDWSKLSEYVDRLKRGNIRWQMRRDTGR